MKFNLLINWNSDRNSSDSLFVLIIISRENLLTDLKRLEQNKGSHCIDGMSVVLVFHFFYSHILSLLLIHSSNSLNLLGESHVVLFYTKPSITLIGVNEG